MSESSYPQPFGVWSFVAMPASHFPTAAVAYPAACMWTAIPVMFLAMPENPATGSKGLTKVGSTFCTLTWIGFLPLWMEDRVGEQNLNV